MKYTDMEDSMAGKYIPQHILVYGLSKSGKSTLVANLARQFNLIWLSNDGGHTVISKLPAEARQNVDLIWTPDTKEAPFSFDTTRKLMRGSACSVCHNHGIVNCTTCKMYGAAFSSYEFNKNDSKTIVVTDHLTQTTTSCLNVITKGKADDYRPERDDWGSLHYHMGALLSTYQNAQFHVIALAQVEEAEQDDKSKKIGPSVGSSKFTRNVGQYFDHIVYTRIRNKTHEAGSGTGYEASVITGSRADVEVEKQPVADLSVFFKHQPQSAGQKQQVAETVKVLQEAKQVIAEVKAELAPSIVAKPSTSDLLARLKNRA